MNDEWERTGGAQVSYDFRTSNWRPGPARAAKSAGRAERKLIDFPARAAGRKRWGARRLLARSLALCFSCVSSGASRPRGQTSGRNQSPGRARSRASFRQVFLISKLARAGCCANTHLVETLYMTSWHCSPPTRILSWISRSFEPKFEPSIVSRVPPSSGPQVGWIWAFVWRLWCGRFKPVSCCWINLPLGCAGRRIVSNDNQPAAVLVIGGGRWPSRPARPVSARAGFWARARDI